MLESESEAEVETEPRKPLWPKSEEELIECIRKELGLLPGSMPASYNEAPEIVARITEAAFNYAACHLGMTGFQAGFARMRFLASSGGFKHGFMILDAKNLLYPQYDLIGKAREWIKETRPTLAKAAQELVAESGNSAHPEVVARWKEIAALVEPAL